MEPSWKEEDRLYIHHLSANFLPLMKSKKMSLSFWAFFLSLNLIKSSFSMFILFILIKNENLPAISFASRSFFFPLLDVMKSSGFLSCQPPSWFSSLEVNFSSGIQSMQSCWDTQQETWLIIQPFTYWIMFCKRLDIYFIIGHRKKKNPFRFQWCDL